MCGVPIRYFCLNNEIYIHQIFSSEDDRVELVDDSGTMILTFDATMRVFNHDKVQIGHIQMEERDGFCCWCFVPCNVPYDQKTIIWGGSVRLVESHIDLEVEVSKWYLQTCQQQEVLCLNET